MFEKALGVSSQELFAMMERGELMAEDVLPKVAVAFGEMARQGGALGKQLESGRTQQQRFTASMQEAADLIYQSGFEEGISDMFKTITEEIMESKEALQAAGQIFKWFFKTIGLAVKIVQPLLDGVLFVVGTIFEMINELNDYLKNNFYSTLLITGGGLLYLTGGFGKLGLAGLGAKKILSGVTAVLSTMFMKVLLVIGIFDEFFALFKKGRMGMIELAMGKDLGLEDFKNMTESFNKDLKKESVESATSFNFNNPFSGMANPVHTGVNMLGRLFNPVQTNSATPKSTTVKNENNLTVEFNGANLADEESRRQIVNEVESSFKKMINMEADNARIVGAG